MSAPLLEVDNVGRSFGGPRGAFWAVRDLSLRLEQGEIVTLLGPNGAGKTTLMKMVSTLLAPTTGTIRVGGVDVGQNPSAVKARLALVLGGDRGFFLRASAAENLRYFASLAGVPLRSRVARIDAVLAAVGLAHRRNDKVETYSRGMRQRLHIARGLLAAPPLLLLDEPTLGLDPESAQALRDRVRELVDDGHGVLLTTHYLHEAEALSARSAVIIGGRKTVEGRAADIAAAGGLGLVTTFTTGAMPEATVQQLRSLSGVRHVRVESLRGQRQVSVGWERDTPDLDALSRVTDQLLIESSVSRPATLEEGYLALIDVTSRTRSGAESS